MKNAAQSRCPKIEGSRIVRLRFRLPRSVPPNRRVRLGYELLFEEMTLQIASVVKDAQNVERAWLAQPVDQEVPGIPDYPDTSPCAVATVVQVV